MSRHYLLFLCLALCSLCHATQFQRPSENQTWVAEHPYIWTYGAEIWWNLPEFEKILESASLDSIHSVPINGSAAQFLVAAKQSRQSAQTNFQVCRQQISIPVGLNSLPGGAILSSLSFIPDFIRIYNCMLYRYNWEDTLDHSLSFLEIGIADSETAIEKARKSFKEMEFMGLCDASYVRTGSEYCSELKNAFTATDMNIAEGHYGKTAYLREEIEFLKKQLALPCPDLSPVTIISGIIWSEEGILSSFSRLDVNARDSISRAEEEFEVLKTSASGRKKLVASELEEFLGDDPHLITKAPSNAAYHTAGTIAAMTSNLIQKNTDLSLRYEDLLLERERTTKRAYLSTAIMGMAEVDLQYGEVISDISLLHASAYNVTARQKQEAEDELAKTEQYMKKQLPSPEAIQLYETAKERFEQGSIQPTLGKSFFEYSKAVSTARSARSARDYGQEFDTAASLLLLEDIIRRAEADKINVVTEKQSLSLLKELSPYEVVPYIDSAVENIISKSKIYYDAPLIESREHLMEKIALAGPDAADLHDEILRYEMGLIQGGKILYPDAIGSLNTLLENYAKIEEELELYMSEIAANSIAVKTMPLITNVRLDEPADLQLDILLVNERPFQAENVEIMVRNPIIPGFIISDAVVGREHLASFHFEDGYLVLVLNHVEPFETKRITLEKKMTIAHTLSKNSSAVGLGNGRAKLSELLKFELDCDTPQVDLSDFPMDSVVDGMQIPRPLSAGTHALSYRTTVEDAYFSSIENMVVYPLGIKSKVQYSVHLLPALDMAVVPLVLDIMNNSDVSSIELFSMTGESITDRRSLSPTQYGFDINDVKKDDTAIISVSYMVENTESYVSTQLDYFDSFNLSADTQKFLDVARTCADSGDYSAALENLENLKQTLQQEEKNSEKLRKKYEELELKLTTELHVINQSLTNTSQNSEFVDKLKSRKNEIQRILSECSALDLKQKILLLEKIDYKWMDKELTVLIKSLYKEYNSLKETYYSNGVIGTPNEFLTFESLLTALETGRRLETAITAVDGLETIRSIILLQQDEKYKQEEQLMLVLDSLKSEVFAVLEHYSKEASSAKGTDYSTMFIITEKKVEDAVKDAEKSLEQPTIFSAKINYLNQTKTKMTATLDILKNESASKISLLNTLLSQSDMDDDGRSDFRGKIAAIETMVQRGDYVNALRAGTAVANELESYENDTNEGIMLLGATALAIMVTVTTYIIRQNLEAKSKKPLRKLKSIEDERKEMASAFMAKKEAPEGPENISRRYPSESL